MSEDKLFDRVPPRDLDAEMSSLGAILLEPESLHELAQTLKPQDFYATSHQIIYEAMLKLFERTTAIDVVILKDELARTGQLPDVGGADYLLRLAESVPSAANVQHYARIVRKKSQLRNLIRCATDILRRAYQDSDDVDDVLAQSEQQIFSLTKSGPRLDAVEIRDALHEAMAFIDAQQSNPGRMTGHPTGFRDLDEKLSGLHGGQMVVVAARPSMGKTSLALNIAENFGIAGTGVLIFTLEMATGQIAQNLLCSNARVDVHRVRRSLLDAETFDRLVKAAGRLSSVPIFIDDSAGLTMLQIRAKARRIDTMHKIGLVVVDYLQLVSSPSAENRQQEITQISMAMKHMARELNVPVIAISQLNRSVDAREDHRPRMSDLRESGSIEQDADIVLFLYRPDYYEPDRPELQGRAELIIAKHRSGPTGTVPLTFMASCMRFGDSTPLEISRLMQAAGFKRVSLVVLAFVLAPFLSARARAQATPEPAPKANADTVVEIILPDDLVISKELILGTMKTKVGKPLLQKEIDDDIVALWHDFGIRASFRLEQVSGGWRVTIEGSRRLEINSFKFVGNDEKNEKTLKELIGTTPAQIRSVEDLYRAQRRLEDTYKEDGYAFATVEKPEVVQAESGNTAVFTIHEGPHVAVDDIEFIGLTAFSERQMRSLMTTSRTFLFFKSYFKRSVVDRDLAVLESFLRDEGFRDASVGLEDLRFKSGGSRVDIVIRINQGERYTVTSVDIDGNEVFTKEELMALIRLKPGDPYRITVVRNDLRRLKSYYGEHGYIRFEPLNPGEVFSEEGAQVKVTYRFHENRRKRLRDVIIRGATDTRDDVIRRVLPLYPGDWFNTKEIEYASNRLRSLGFFTDPKGGDRLKIHNEKTEDVDYEDLYIDVEEGRSGLITFQVGTSTGRGVFAGINITKPNFDITRLPTSLWALPSEFFDRKAFHGGGQLLEANLLPGTRDTFYDVKFEEPYLFGPQELPWSLAVTFYKRDSQYRNYDLGAFGGILTVGKMLARDLQATVGLRSERITVSNLSDSLESGDPLNPTDFSEFEGKNSLRSLRFRVNYDHRDNFRNPTDGWRAISSYEYAGSFLGGELDFTKFLIGGERYIPIYENEKGERHVLFGGLRFGAADSYGSDDQVPFFERFYGGASTFDFLAGNFQLRGFDFRGVGPHYGSEPLGGTAAAAATVEYIFPIASYFDAPSGEEITFLKGVCFVDSGTIASDFASDDWDHWRLSVGVGIRLKIPLPILAEVPLRIDYGIPLLIEEEDERHSFSINLSTRF